MGRLLLFLAILALLWALFRAFIRYLRDASPALPQRTTPTPTVDPEKVAWYRRRGYREWVRYRVGYTLYTRPSGTARGETVIEERSSLSPWFPAGSEEEERWLAEEHARPSQEGEAWSTRWIAGRGVRDDERRWLPPGEQPS